jgi:hypothetical protein
MEASQIENRKLLKRQIPDIEASLAAVRMLQERKAGAAADGGADGTFTTHFSLADQLFAQAEVKPEGTVNLWLGVSGRCEGGRGAPQHIPHLHFARTHRPVISPHPLPLSPLIRRT